MSRLVSAEEARGLLERATPGPWVANLDDDKRAASRDWRVVDTDVRFVVGADWYERHSAGETETVCGVKIAEADAAMIAAAPALAATVIALSEERDRLRAILACERGEKAPEGWSWLVDDNFNAMLVGTVRDATGWPVTVRRTVPRGWSADGGRTVHSFALLAAEAIEAADRAAGEVKP